MILVDSELSALPPKTEESSNTDEHSYPPPPYAPTSSAAGTSAVAGQDVASQSPPAERSGSLSVFQPQNPQLVNQFSLVSKQNAISGTYLVDPLLRAPIPKPHISQPRRSFLRKAPTPEIHANFHARHNAIKLDLGVVGEETGVGGSGRIPAHIVVSSRKGDIVVNLFEIQPTRCVHLHVKTRKGDVLLLLPPTFHGAIAFQTRNKGAVDFLPGFGERAQIARASDHETIVIFHSSADHSPIPQKEEDCCVVRSHGGHITVGVSGIDRVDSLSKELGLLKRLGALVRARVEAHGKALGEYVQTQAKMLEAGLAKGTELAYER